MFHMDPCESKTSDSLSKLTPAAFEGLGKRYILSMSIPEQRMLRIHAYGWDTREEWQTFTEI